MAVGATWIVWTMKDDTGNKTQAATKIIVKKPITELQFSESSVDIAVGEAKLLCITGTEGNTIPKNLSFSIKGNGVKVSPSGCVFGLVPGSTATVIAKSGKINTSIKVNVSGNKNKYMALNKNTVNVVLPKSGSKAKTFAIKIAKPKKKTAQPSVDWSISGSPAGITVKDGKVTVTSAASPGRYVIVASPVDSSSDYRKTCCELIIQ